MKLVKATDDDNERLLHYFGQAPIPGPAQLRLRRMFNFYNHYRLQSEDFVTYILQDEKEKIQAMASILFREAVVDGKKEMIGYATDLRVSPQRNAIMSWAQYFMPVLEAERSLRNCRYIFSVVSSSQTQAYNAFIRPRMIRRQMPRYHLFRRFQMVTVHGMFPFHAKPLSGILMRTANEKDKESVAQYILKQTRSRPLTFYDSVEGFIHGIDRWYDFGIENFLLAEDTKGNIIGCVAPWSSERVQRITPLKYNSKAQNLHDALWFLSWFGITKPISSVNRDFEFRFLTHLFADNPDIFYSLLYHAFEMAGKKEFLVYPHFEGELLTRPPRSFISAEMNFGLYCILSPTDPIPDFLKPRQMNLPPVFEPAFL